MLTTLQFLQPTSYYTSANVAFSDSDPLLKTFHSYFIHKTVSNFYHVKIALSKFLNF